jgi:hypothetical protein
MSAGTRQARRDYSRGFSAFPGRAGGLAPLRALLALAGLAGAALLLVATFATVIHINVVTVTKVTASGWDRHGPALLIIAIASVLMLAGALRGARPAMAALAALGLVALLIALIGDQPHIHDTGAIGQDYDQATAGPSFGYYAETLGAVLLLLSGALMLVLSGVRGRAEAADTPPGAPTPAQPDPDVVGREIRE